MWPPAARCFPLDMPPMTPKFEIPSKNKLEPIISISIPIVSDSSSLLLFGGGGGGGLLEPRVYNQKEMEQNRTKQFKPQ